VVNFSGVKSGDKATRKRKSGTTAVDNASKEGKRSKKNDAKSRKKEEKRKRQDSSSSSEGSVSSSSSSSESSESSQSSSSNSSRGPGRKKGDEKKSKKQKKRDKDWDLLEELWPVEDRPRRLQDRAYVSGLSVTKMMKLKEQYEKEAEKKGVGCAVFGKDKKPKSKKFKEMKDDGERKLHPSRFIPMPRVEPDKYWRDVPVGWHEVYRHLPLQHVGAEGVPESTIVKLHNRKVPVELHMLRKEPITETRHVEEAVMSFIAVLRQLHLADYSGLVVQRVMAEGLWAEGWAMA
jgi:hypothetical protein